MQGLRDALEFIRTRMSGLSASAKLLAGSLVVILALGLFLVAQWSATTDAVPFAVQPTAYEDARQFLATRGVEYAEENGQLLVPADRHAGLLADFAQSGGAADLNIGDLVPSDPFAPESERGRRHLFAVQTVLSKVIGGFRNVKSATVIIAPKSSTPLGSMRNAQTASVTVVMRSGRLAQEQVDAIAALVAGTQSGMKPQNVSITDGGVCKPTGIDGLASGNNLAQKEKVEHSIEESIETALGIPGARIAVNAQVVTTERTSTTTEFKEGVVAPISEFSSSSEAKGANGSREPGVVPNTGLSLGAPGATGSQSAVERSEAKYRAEIPATRRTEVDPTGYATRIDASVTIPWSYFVQVWRMKNPAAEDGEAREPAEGDLVAVRDEELGRVKRLVEPLVNTDGVEGSKRGAVEVGWYYDFEQAPLQASVAGGLGELVLGSGGGSGGAGGLVKPIGLGVLAIASLFFMFNIARTASAREELPSAEELAGVPPKLESDDAEIVGEADEATPALEGMELDDDSLRRAQMLDQLNELAKREPAEIAGILRRWMRTTA
ncbi:MAG: flagellar M-ring protein FliF C-terminal domain-containing protein [Phycisphaerales bacterium]